MICFTKSKRNLIERGYSSKIVFGFADKRSMVEATTASLAEALKGLRVRLMVILDGCPDYEQIFTSAFSVDGDVKLTLEKVDSVGNQATWGMQLDALSKVDDSDYVYFSEDDYIYRPDAFRAMLDFIRRDDVDFVTPLDHPDRYNGRLEKPYPCEIRVSDFCHWREAPSSCLTFMGKAKVVSESKSIMDSFRHSPEEATLWLGLTKYGVFDFPAMLKVAFRHFILRQDCGFGELMALCTWKRQGIKLLTKPRRQLFSPIPSLAVHLANCSLPRCSSTILEGRLSQVNLDKVLNVARTC